MLSAVCIAVLAVCALPDATAECRDNAGICGGDCTGSDGEVGTCVRPGYGEQCECATGTCAYDSYFDRCVGPGTGSYGSCDKAGLTCAMVKTGMCGECR